MAAGKRPATPETPEENVKVDNRFIGGGGDINIGAITETAPLKVTPSEDMTVWQNADKWKTPQWLDQKRGEKPKEKNSYHTYYVNMLRTRYLVLEGDFRTVYNNFYHSDYMDLNTAKLIIGYLQSAKKALESEDADINDVTTILNLADQGMVWLYPPHVAKERAIGLGANLQAQGSAWGSYLVGEATNATQTLGGLRAALDATKEAVNKASQDALITNGLQIERLRTARNWSVLMLIGALIFLPFLINFDADSAKMWNETAIGKIAMKTTTFTVVDSTKISELNPTGIISGVNIDKSNKNNSYLISLLLMLCIAVIGAGGAFFSSLMQVRNPNLRANLSDFQEKQSDSQLKITVGAITAMILFVFLTWQILPGIEIKNVGSFLFLAFLSGFSERYFLNILHVDNQGDNMLLPQKPAPAAVLRPVIEPQENAIDPAEGDVNNRRIN